jgi:SSS family solute:Na+ symporter
MAVDIVKHFRPSTTDRGQVLIGRVTAVVVMLLAMAWSTQGDKFGSIFEAINKMPAQFLAPPISVVFVWGVFWRRGTKQAALTTLILGFILGFIVFLIDLPAFGTVQWVSDAEHGLGISFMMQAVWGFAFWSVVYVLVSLVTPAPAEEQVEQTTWPHPLRVILHGRLTGLTDPRALAALLFAGILVLYAVFR